MSDDFVNQLTLNFLISKNQLQKLNKKVSETSDMKKIKEINEKKERIKKLFDDLLVCCPPEDLLYEVKLAFDNFVDKSIYYFKAHDNSLVLENERSSNDYIKDDIDYEREERAIENGNYREQNNTDLSEDDNNDDDETEEEMGVHESDILLEEAEIVREVVNHNPVIVNKKYNKHSSSIGVDDIQKLPLDWFQNARQDYKKNQIIPRKKEPTIYGNQNTDIKKKI